MRPGYSVRPMAVRLRQAVLVAQELAPVADRMREELGLGQPYADPGVGHFGLENAVFAIGDTFLEVVSPTRPGTAAGRYLDQHGDGGYMLIFQFDDLEAARERAATMGMRTVWQLDLDDISGTHLHPADTGGAILSLDRADPPESWRWGGPDWTGKAGTGAPGRVAGVTVTSPRVAELEERWRALLDEGADQVRFEPGEAERLTEVQISVPDRQGEIEIGGARFRLS